MPGSEPFDVAFEGVSKSFTAAGRSFAVLEDLSLEIRAGEFLSIVGASGCGKSTLLRMIAGLEVPDRGRVRLGSQPVSGPGRDRGIVFQEPRLFPWFTVEQNVAFALEGDPAHASRTEVQAQLELVGLTPFRGAYPHQLSGGMAQRVAIARALVSRPRILLLDEPFGALDALTRIQLQHEILRIQLAERTTMVLVTHDIDEAIFLGDRVAVMAKDPGRFQSITPVNLPRPRSRSSYEFVRIRKSIYAQFFAEEEEPFAFSI
jgi:sulfonate transport system ATP-binding protein